jgi:competence protein ComEA
VVAERLKAVLAEVPVGAPAPLPGRGALADLARVGEPLRWSDIIPGWSEEVGGDSRTGGGAGWPAEGFPEGSAWALPPGMGPVLPVVAEGSDLDLDGPAESALREFAERSGGEGPGAPAVSAGTGASVSAGLAVPAALAASAVRAVPGVAAAPPVSAVSAFPAAPDGGRDSALPSAVGVPSPVGVSSPARKPRLLLPAAARTPAAAARTPAAAARTPAAAAQTSEAAARALGEAARLSAGAGHTSGAAAAARIPGAAGPMSAVARMPMGREPLGGSPGARGPDLGGGDRVLTSEDFDGASWEIVSPGVTEVSVAPGGSRTSSVPPSWVLPERPEAAVEDPLARLGVSESWAAPPEEHQLTAAGAFGGNDDRKERRMGLRAFDPGRRGVRALAAVAVLVIVVAAFLAWRARPRVEPVAAPSFGSDAGAVTDGPAAPTSAAPSAAEVIVAVEGKVEKPGVVHLPAGSRVADALEAAGGAKPGVDVAMLNLARKVVDGELILVGVTPSPGMSVPAAAGGATAAGGPVNLNTATLADLDTLPGVGPVLAQRILDARTAQGGFKAVSDLRKVDGIGDARYEELKDLVTV